MFEIMLMVSLPVSFLSCSGGPTYKCVFIYKALEKDLYCINVSSCLHHQLSAEMRLRIVWMLNNYSSHQQHFGTRLNKMNAYKVIKSAILYIFIQDCQDCGECTCHLGFLTTNREGLLGSKTLFSYILISSVASPGAFVVL